MDGATAEELSTVVIFAPVDGLVAVGVRIVDGCAAGRRKDHGEKEGG
jgi:hypothetical protein